MQIEYLEPEPGIRLRTACWEPDASPPLADVLVLNGRSEFVEKYEPTAKRLTAMGLRAWSLDWRGQGLSTRLLPNPQMGHISDFADYLVDLRAFLDHIRQRGGQPTRLLAHSMGAHIGIRYLMDTPDHGFESAVFCAPLVALKLAHWQAILAPGLTTFAKATGRLEDYAIGQDDWNAAKWIFDDNPLTRDREQFEDLLQTLRQRPELRLGGVTWGWFRAALTSCRHLAPPGREQRLLLPCLVFRAGGDTIVDNRRMAAFTSRLPAGTLIDMPDARHEILRETPAVRDTVWSEIERHWSPTRS